MILKLTHSCLSPNSHKLTHAHTHTHTHTHTHMLYSQILPYTHYFSWALFRQYLFKIGRTRASPFLITHWQSLSIHTMTHSIVWHFWDKGLIVWYASVACNFLKYNLDHFSYANCNNCIAWVEQPMV